MNYTKIVILSVLLTLTAANGYCTDPTAADTATAKSEAAQEPASDIQPAASQADANAATTANQPQDVAGMTLKAEKVPAQAANSAGQQYQVPPASVSQQPYPQQAPYMPPKIKKVPIYLQPFEFVISSVVNTLTFWQKGDELNKPVWERGKNNQ